MRSVLNYIIFSIANLSSLHLLTFLVEGGTAIKSTEDLPSGLIFEGFDASTEYPNLSTTLSSVLLALRVKARVVDATAEVTIDQEFLTPSFFPTTAGTQSQTQSFYQIPMDELAAVTNFRATVRNRVIEAVVKERDEARREFEEAIEQGKNAYIAEQTRPDIFYLGMGNLPMGEVVRVTLVYVTPLESLRSGDGDVGNIDNQYYDTLRFVFPTEVAPRYRPLNDSEEEILGDRAFSIAKGVEIDVEVLHTTGIHSGRGVSSITSSTHDISLSGLLVAGNKTDGQDDSAGVTFVHVEDEDPQERDFVLYIRTERQKGKNEPQVFFEHSKTYNSTAMMISFVPDLLSTMALDDIELTKTAPPKMEFIFVIDQSGSMEGLKMKQTKKAMSLIVESIPEGSLVNIVGFGSTYTVLFEEGSRLIYSNEEGFKNDAKSEILAYIDSMEANLGGTELLPALQYVLRDVDDDAETLSSFSSSSFYRRVVLVLTDGEVSNTDDTIEYIQRQRQRQRHQEVVVSSLGIGEHVSALLVRGIARAGHGTAEFVDGEDSSAIEAAVSRQMDASTRAFATDVSVSWPTENGSQAPFHLPDLISGQRFMAYYVIDHTNELYEIPSLTENLRTGVVKLTSSLRVVNNQSGSTGDTTLRKWVLEVSGSSFVDVMSSNENKHDEGGMPLLHTMACRSLIRDLEEGGSELHLESSEFDSNANKKTIDAEITRLGVKCGIASSQTSFVAVDNEGWTTLDAMASEVMVANGGSNMMAKGGSNSKMADDMMYRMSTSSGKRARDGNMSLLRYLLVIFGLIMAWHSGTITATGKNVEEDK